MLCVCTFSEIAASLYATMRVRDVQGAMKWNCDSACHAGGRVRDLLGRRPVEHTTMNHQHHFGRRAENFGGLE